MKILALEREVPVKDAVTDAITDAGPDPAPSASLLRAEARRLWELAQGSVVRESYFDADRHTAVLVLECADLDEARQHLSTLPLVEACLITFELIPLVPYSGFARLFDQDRGVTEG